QELARSLSEQGHERLGRANEKRVERQLDGRDSQHSGLESPRQPINSVSASQSTNRRSHTAPAETNRDPPKAIAAAPAQPTILSNSSSPPNSEDQRPPGGSSPHAQRSK